MSLRTYRTFQSLILGGLGVYLFGRVMGGQILFYINQRFVLLVLMGSIGLILLAQLVMRERPAPEVEDGKETVEIRGDDHHQLEQRPVWALWLIALPLLIGILAPVRPLSARALTTRGVNTGSGILLQNASAWALDIPAGQRTVLDWIRAAEESQNPGQLTNLPADVTGFVVHDTRLGEGQFLVGRFTIACCVADAVALGIVVSWPDAGQIPDNHWVRVRGATRLIEFDGRQIPMVEASSVEIIPEPEQPYLFP